MTKRTELPSALTTDMLARGGWRITLFFYAITMTKTTEQEDWKGVGGGGGGEGGRANLIEISEENPRHSAFVSLINARGFTRLLV